MRPAEVKPSWDQTFMDMAFVISRRSKDPNTRVGAVIAMGKQLVSVGFNGPSEFIDDNEVSWVGESADGLDKYDLVLHAEVNAYRFARRDIRGATMYVTGIPCKDCMKLISAVGVRRVIFGSATPKMCDEKNQRKTLAIAKRAGVILIPWEVEHV
jgi:dCMP deaminase